MLFTRRSDSGCDEPGIYESFTVLKYNNGRQRFALIIFSHNLPFFQQGEHFITDLRATPLTLVCLACLSDSGFFVLC